MRKPLLLVVAAAVLALSRPAVADAPPVIVSIRPLHSLVAAVMQGVGEPALLVGGGASPHAFALKPSDARALEKARLVVWVGPGFETFLSRTFRERTGTLAMTGLPGLTLLDTREGGVWEEEKHGSDHHHGHDETDGHLWLDPANAGRLVAAVAERLAALDPAHAAIYVANAAATAKRLEALDGELAARLRPLAGKPYVVFHDAYQYLEHRYGLTPAGAITVDPERPPSGRRLAALRDRLKSARAACVFREPQSAGPTVQALADAAGAKVGLLDPEGAEVEPGPDGYFVLMRRLAESLSACLSS